MKLFLVLLIFSVISGCQARTLVDKKTNLDDYRCSDDKYEGLTVIRITF